MTVTRSVALTMLVGFFLLLIMSQRSSGQFVLNEWYGNGPSGIITSISIDPFQPNIILVPTSEGVYRSIDYGASWGLFVQNPSHSVNNVIFDPVVPNTLYLTNNDGLFKSQDGGANWTQINTPVPINGLVLADSDPKVAYATTASAILATSNGGDSWTSLSVPPAPFVVPDPELHPGLLVIDPQAPRTIYLYMTDYETFIGLYKSTDGGASWTNISYGGERVPATFDLKIDPSNSNIIYAATYFGVLKSTDGGFNWSTQGSVSNTWDLAIDPYSRTLFAAPYNSGVDSSRDDGTSWTPFNNGLTNPFVEHLAIDRSGRFLHAATSAGVFSVRLRQDSVSVSGRVTAPDGRGLRNVLVSITNSSGVTNTVTTSSFGFYQFEDVAIGEDHTISVSSRSYRFLPQVVNTSTNLTDINFVGFE